MAISGSDLTNIRANSGTHVIRPHVNVTPKVEIATARINQASFSYPLAQLTVDNTSINGGLSWSDILVGSPIYIGTTAGAHDVTTSRVRKPPSGTTLFISVIGSGEPGFAEFEHTLLADDQYITILAVKDPWSFLPRNDSGTDYKFYDVSYVDEGDDPDPVCNIGPWQRLEFDGSSVSGTFTNAAIADVKPASFAWGSKTISSYAWSFRNSSYALNTGGSFSGGSTSAAATIDFDTDGFYIVYCTITDSGGKTHTGETYVWVDDGTLEMDLSDCFIDLDNQGLTGRQLTIVRTGDTDESVIYPGAGVLLTEEHTFNGTTVTAGTTVDTFAGWVKSTTSERMVTHGQVAFDVVGPDRILNEAPMAAQVISEASSPSAWLEISSDLSHPSGLAWYLLHHHCPQMLQVFDFAPLEVTDGVGIDTTLRRKTWRFSGDSIWWQLEEIARKQINVGCASNGGLYLRHEPMQMDSGDRDALDERMTWGPEDIEEKLRYRRDTRNNVGSVEAYAFSYNGTTETKLRSLAAGDAQGQAKSSTTVNDLIAPSTDSQSRLNEISGHLYAEYNNPVPQIVIPVKRNIDTADPARMKWHKLNVSSAYDPLFKGWSNHRVLPTKVSRKWEQQGGGEWLKYIDTTVQPETSGQSGITKQVETSTDDNFVLWDDWPDPFDWEIITDDIPLILPEIDEDQVKMAGLNDDGYLYTTSDFTTTEGAGGPTWARTNLSLSGTIVQFVVDAYSPGYVGGGTSIDGWIVTTTHLYRITDIFGTPGTTSQLTFKGASNWRNIDFSFGFQNWGICVGYYDSSFAPSAGVYTSYTTDGGTTWSTEAAITNHYDTDGTSLDYYPGLYISPRVAGLAYTFAFSSTATSPLGVLYRSQDHGATWATYGGLGVDPQYGLGTDMHIPYTDTTETTVYHGRYASAFYQYIYKVVSGSASDISPQQSGAGGNRPCGPYRARWHIGTSPQDGNYLLVCSKTNYPSRIIYHSTNGGTSWSSLYNGGTRSSRAAFSGDNKSVVYRWGANSGTGDGNMIERYDGSWDDRSGNLRSLGPPGEFIAICGGPTS